MAHEGLRFTHALVNSPVCSPTRFALLTGRYQYRFRGAAEEPLGSSERGSSVLGVLGLLLECKKPKLRERRNPWGRTCCNSSHKKAAPLTVRSLIFLVSLSRSR